MGHSSLCWKTQTTVGASLKVYSIYKEGKSTCSKNNDCKCSKCKIKIFYVKGDKFEKHPDEEYAIDLDFVDELISEVNHSQYSIGDYSKKKIFDIIPEQSVEKLWKKKL
mgnify:CR=1 FL=1